MAGSYFITVDTPPYGVSSTSYLNQEGAAESATAHLAAGRTVYVTTPDGDLVSGRDFLADLADLH